MVALLRASKIPARLVTGFIMKEQPGNMIHYWVEIYFE
jgi:transglutaminase-like putative cysteine protease